MLEGFSASGFLVQSPCGPRKSGIPESVEMPAPVSTTIRRAASIQLRTVAIAALSSCIAQIVPAIESPLNRERRRGEDHLSGVEARGGRDRDVPRRAARAGG